MISSGDTKVKWHAWFYDNKGRVERATCHLWFDDADEADDFVQRLLRDDPKCNPKMETADGKAVER